MLRVPSENARTLKMAGREWHPAGEPETVQMHDFPDPRVGKAIPYGVYDINRNEGWVNVGIDHDTPDFAVAAIRAWRKRLGSRRYPNATDLMINADSGGSNSARSRGWKMALQKLADETGIRVTVCHFPPGTSKWNKIEHRMFCHISQNWRGRPLLTHDIVVNLIANTATRASSCPFAIQFVRFGHALSNVCAVASTTECAKSCAETRRDCQALSAPSVSP